MYDDNDSEEMSEREFVHFSLPPKAQARAHVSRLGGDQWLKELSSCNCAKGHCYHPRTKHTPHFNPSVSPSDSKSVVAKSGIRKSDTSEGKMKYPSREPPVIPEYYAACHFPERMPDVVDTYNPIQGMLSHTSFTLTANHRFGLRTFDCTAAYLQAELKKLLYARSPKGLMSVLQKEMGEKLGPSPSDFWKFRKTLYGYAGSSRLWWDKVSTWLKGYGFRPLCNSGTFLIFDRRDADDVSMQGIILLNLYSDDGLAC